MRWNSFSLAVASLLSVVYAGSSCANLPSDFTASPASATAFCSSYLHITNTVTTQTTTLNPVTTFVTSTSTTSTAISITATITTTVTVTLPQLTTVTVTDTTTSTDTVTATTETTSTVTTVTQSSTITSTYTEHDTTFTTVTQYNPAKRSIIKRSASAPPQCRKLTTTSTWNSWTTPSSTTSIDLSSACSCLNIAPIVTTTTVTLTQVTSTATQTTVQTVSGTITVTATAGATVTTTTPQTVTATTTVTTVITTTSTSTSEVDITATTTDFTYVYPTVHTTTTSTIIKALTGCPNGPASPSAISGTGFGVTYSYMCCADAANEAALSNKDGFFGSPDPGADQSGVSEQTCADNCAGSEAYLGDCLGFTFTASGGTCLIQGARGPIVSRPGSVACYQVGSN